MHDLTVTLDAMTPGEIRSGGEGVQVRHGVAQVTHMRPRKTQVPHSIPFDDGPGGDDGPFIVVNDGETPRQQARRVVGRLAGEDNRDVHRLPQLGMAEIAQPRRNERVETRALGLQRVLDHLADVHVLNVIGEDHF